MQKMQKMHKSKKHQKKTKILVYVVINMYLCGQKKETFINNININKISGMLTGSVQRRFKTQLRCATQCLNHYCYLLCFLRFY